MNVVNNTVAAKANIMHVRFDNLAEATIDGKKTPISMVDILNGKVGQVKSISIDIELAEVKGQPTLNFVDIKQDSNIAKPSGASPTDSSPAIQTPESIKVKKDSKVAKLIKVLMKKGGANFSQIATALGMSEGGAGSYLYYYPKMLGFELKSLKDEKKKVTFYSIEVPAGRKLEFV